MAAQLTLGGRMKVHIREVLAIVTGLHPGAPFFCHLQEFFDFLPNGSLETKKDLVLKRFPRLAECENDFSDAEREVLCKRRQASQDLIDDILARWLGRQIDKFGEYFEFD